MNELTACECPVCLRRFGSKRIPLSTPCGHTFCSPCMEDLFNSVHKKGEDVFSCPFCRYVVPKDAVKINHALQQLIEQIRKIERFPAKSLATKMDSSHPLLNVRWEDINLLESLDAGAFGEVHRGDWKGSETAVKVFHMGKLTEKCITSFQSEFLVMSCLRHPNVVLLMGACQGPKPCIIMEFMRGGSLSHLLHNRSELLSIEDTVMIAEDIARGLQYLHSINIIHRDLKSKNVLLSGDLPCQAKICDFGLSRVRQESETLTGNIGTVYWTAPEVLNNQRYHFAADIYSYGMVLVEMVSGKIPFSEMRAIAVVMAVAVRREKPTVPCTTDQRLKKLIEGCIAWNQDNRLNLLQILEQLNEILPPKKQPLKRQLSHQEHSDSLGVLYFTGSTISEGSSADEEEIDNEENGKESMTSESELHSIDQMEEYVEILNEPVLFNEANFELDDQLLHEQQEQEKLKQIEQDRELAHQLQEKEYSYTKPVNPKEKPNVDLSNLIQNKMQHFEKHNVVSEKIVENRSGSSGSRGDSNNKVFKHRLSSSSLKEPPKSALEQVAMFDKSLLKKTPRKGAGHPPAPPPVPPIQQSASPVQQTKSVKPQQGHKPHPSLVHAFPRFKLKHVQTVEKMFFPVGKVVEYKLHPRIQEDIAHFNKKHLTHVEVPERPPLLDVFPELLRDNKKAVKYLPEDVFPSKKGFSSKKYRQQKSAPAPANKSEVHTEPAWHSNPGTTKQNSKTKSFFSRKKK